MRRQLVAFSTFFVVIVAAAGGPDPAVARGAGEPALPNLFAYPPSFVIGPVSGKLPYYDPTSADAPVVDGCFAEERAAGARRCLRFLTKVVNFDLGALMLVVRPGPSGPAVYQVVGDRELPAGSFSFDPVRREMQVDDFWIMRLWRFDGRRKAGPPVASTGLRGLCPGFAFWIERAVCANNAQGGRTPMIVLPWLLYAYYPPDGPGQYLEISGVRDGLYVLEIEIDPKDHIQESYERDNTTCVVVRLRGRQVSERRSDYCWPRRS